MSKLNSWNRRRRELSNFSSGDFDLVANNDFSAGKKLPLRWRGTRRVVRSINDYVRTVKDMRNDDIDDILLSRLKFYHDYSFDSEAILSRVISSETGMVVQRLMALDDCKGGLKAHVPWKGPSPSEDTEGPVDNIYQDAPDLFKNYSSVRTHRLT